MSGKGGKRRLGGDLRAWVAVCCLVGFVGIPDAGGMSIVRKSVPREQVAAQDAVGEARIDALELVRSAIDLTRGLSSYAEMRMFIKRPAWERNSRLIAWTRGREDALIRFTAPARDAGNAMLKLNEKMWTFNPRLNRNIRLPSSMMSQSWAGSDFSYNDLSRSDKYLRHYDLQLMATEESEGHLVYTIDAIPKEDAPVVWGKERLIIRDDYVMLKLIYFDQDMVALKQMNALTIGEMGGRTIATAIRMMDLEKTDSFTEVHYERIEFDVVLEDRLFTTFALQSGRTH